MNIGIAVEGTCTAGIEKICDHIELIGYQENTSELLYDIVSENLNQELYIERLPEIGLTFAELAEVFKLLTKHKKEIIFLDKGPLYYLNDQQYFSFANEIIKNESSLTRYRHDFN